MRRRAALARTSPHASPRSPVPPMADRPPAMSATSAAGGWRSKGACGAAIAAAAHREDGYETTNRPQDRDPPPGANRDGDLCRGEGSRGSHPQRPRRSTRPRSSRRRSRLRPAICCWSRCWSDGSPMIAAVLAALQGLGVVRWIWTNRAWLKMAGDRPRHCRVRRSLALGAARPSRRAGDRRGGEHGARARAGGCGAMAECQRFARRRDRAAQRHGHKAECRGHETAILARRRGSGGGQGGSGRARCQRPIRPEDQGAR